MLKTPIIHPGLLAALGKCGHKCQILIADSNYAYSSNVNNNAEIVYLNLAPGLIDAQNVLKKVLECINVESATMMQAPVDFDNVTERSYREILGKEIPIDFLERYAFYDKVKSDATSLVIATGETRRFANIILTVGVVK